MSERAGAEGRLRREAAHSLGDSVRDFLKSSGLLRRKAFRELPECWEDIVGPDLARGSQVLGVQKGVVLVSVSSPAVKQELDVFRKEQILALLRERYPGKNILSLKCVYHSSGNGSRPV